MQAFPNLTPMLLTWFYFSSNKKKTLHERFDLKESYQTICIWIKKKCGVEGWGEKAYDCNWIIIKIKKKKKKQLALILQYHVKQSILAILYSASFIFNTAYG